MSGFYIEKTNNPKLSRNSTLEKRNKHRAERALQRVLQQRARNANKMYMYNMGYHSL